MKPGFTFPIDDRTESFSLALSLSIASSLALLTGCGGKLVRRFILVLGFGFTGTFLVFLEFRPKMMVALGGNLNDGGRL